ncbi:MAG: sigma-70 family RNA polymerase sigma factor [Muribaculaceae bacterium]|nr:sigma-70 family RNA polymerase sigma factor [Muribaculaceae bacterium]
MTLSESIFEDFQRGKIESFYTYIYPDLLVYATNLLRGDSAIRAEDCVQDAVEVSYVRRMEFVSGRQWMSFIITCIRNRAISILRHEDAQNKYLTHLEMELTNFKDAYHDYIELETKSRLYNAIASLPEDLKQIFNLSFEQGLRNPQIAAQLGVAEITVKKRKAKLINRLRILLNDDNSTLMLFFLLAA